jgi:hypothetical protein
MAQDERNEIRHEVFRIIRSDPAVKALACVTCVQSAYSIPSIKDKDDLYEATYKPVLERFQYYLQDLKKLDGTQHFGIIVCDHRGLEDDARLRRHHEKLLHSKGEFVSSFNNLIESLFLQSSNLSVGIQLADMVAGAVWRFYERSDAQ